MLGLSSSYGTSTVSLTLVGSRVSTALFTSMFSNWLGPCAGDAGDGDALGAWRSRSPARPRDPRWYATADGGRQERRVPAGSGQGRDGGIRTHDLPLPKRTRYQAAPRPVTAASLLAGGRAGGAGRPVWA